MQLLIQKQNKNKDVIHKENSTKDSHESSLPIISQKKEEKVLRFLQTQVEMKNTCRS